MAANEDATRLVSQRILKKLTPDSLKEKAQRLWQEGKRARDRANHGNEAASAEYKKKAQELSQLIANSEQERLEGDNHILSRIASDVAALQDSNAAGSVNVAALGAEKSVDGDEAEKSVDGDEAEKSGDGSEAEKSGDGSEAEKSGDASEAEKSGDGSEAEKSSDGSEAEKSGDGSEEEKSVDGKVEKSDDVVSVVSFQRKPRRRRRYPPPTMAVENKDSKAEKSDDGKDENFDDDSDYQDYLKSLADKSADETDHEGWSTDDVKIKCKSFLNEEDPSLANATAIAEEMKQNDTDELTATRWIAFRRLLQKKEVEECLWEEHQAKLYAQKELAKVLLYAQNEVAQAVQDVEEDRKHKKEKKERKKEKKDRKKENRCGA